MFFLASGYLSWLQYYFPGLFYKVVKSNILINLVPREKREPGNEFFFFSTRLLNEYKIYLTLRERTDPLENPVLAALSRVSLLNGKRIDIYEKVGFLLLIRWWSFSKRFGLAAVHKVEWCALQIFKSTGLAYNCGYLCSICAEGRVTVNISSVSWHGVVLQSS